MTRSGLLEVVGEGYITTARAKGLSERVVIFTHATRNATIPVITLVGLEFGTLLGGAVVTETVFASPASAGFSSTRSSCATTTSFRPASWSSPRRSWS